MSWTLVSSAAGVRSSSISSSVLPARPSCSTALNAKAGGLSSQGLEAWEWQATRRHQTPVSSLRAKQEIFLAQRSSDERQMRSRRSTHAILSLPHKYRVPLRCKRSLGYARDDDTRERAISHSLSFLHVESCPCGAVYPSPSARPFFKGLHNSHVKTLTLRKVSSPISSFQARNLFHS